MSGMANVYEHEHEHGICSICGGFYSVCKGQHQCQECGRKDAEVARLKAENARLKLLNLMTDEQVVMDLKAEIERIKAILDNENAEMRIKNVLITECAAFASLCADYPLGMVWSVTLRDKARQLVGRAREATR